MLLRVDVRKESTQNKYVAILQCDVCFSEFERSFTKVKKQKFHVCSKNCVTTSLRVGGVLYEKRISSVRSKHGVDHVSQIKSVKEDKKQKSLTKFGCENPFQSEEVKAKSRETCFERYGVKHPMQNSDIMAKRVQTSKNKYKTAFPFERSEVREKAALTNVKHYGVAIPIHSPDIRAKADFSQASLRSHETMKRNGTYNTSKPENKLYEVLCEMFGADDVERQARIHKWPIDFYVKSINTYIQYDSYWHGVGRDIDEVAEHKTKRDVQIHQKMLTDIAQNEYFTERKMRLLRIQNLLSVHINVSVVKLALEEL